MLRVINTFEPVTTIYRDLLPYLAEEGERIEVIVSGAEYRAGRGPLEEALAHPRITVYRVPAGIAQATGRLSKIWILLTYIVGAAVRTLVGARADLTFFLTQPPLFSVWGALLQLLLRRPFGMLVMDIYPDVAIQDGLLDANSNLARLLSAASTFALRQATIVVVIGRCMRDRVTARGVDPQRVRVIHNWANEERIQPVARDSNPLRAEWALDGKFAVMYSGNMGTSHQFDEILEVATRLRDREELVFLFVGGGSRRREVERAKEERGLDNVRLLPFQPLERLAESLSAADLHFISLRDGFEGLVVPSKAYGVLTAGRPILYQGQPQGEIARIIEEERIGTVVPPRDADAVEQALLAYLADPQRAEQEGERARAAGVGRFGRKAALAAYAAALGHAATPEPVRIER